MTLDLKNFVRKPFSVEAVEVTAENILEVATWCAGEMRSSDGDRGRAIQHYIKVNVKKPLNARQTMAYVGDYVVVATDQNIRGFKVYTPRAFRSSYNEILKDISATIERMTNRAIEEDKLEAEGGFAEELRRSTVA